MQERLGSAGRLVQRIGLASVLVLLGAACGSSPSLDIPTETTVPGSVESLLAVDFPTSEA